MSKNQTMSQGARSAENVCLAGSVQGAQTLGGFDSASVDALDDSAVSTALHPLRLLGMGLFVAWLCCVHIPSIFCGESTVLRSVAFMGMRVGDIGMFAIMALIASRLGPLSSRRAMGNVLGCCDEPRLRRCSVMYLCRVMRSDSCFCRGHSFGARWRLFVLPVGGNLLSAWHHADGGVWRRVMRRCMGYVLSNFYYDP